LQIDWTIFKKVIDLFDLNMSSKDFYANTLLYF